MPRIRRDAEQRADTLQANTIAILEWLDTAARSILQYRDTEMYNEARRRAGSKRGAPGLTEAEQALRAEWRRAHANVRNGIWLAERWSQKEIASKTISMSDWALLEIHWNGNNERRLIAIKRQRGDRSIRMPALWSGPAPRQ